MGTDALTQLALRGVAATLLAGLAVAVPSADARQAPRQLVSGICDRGTPQERRCFSPSDGAPPAFHLSVPGTCRTQSVLAATAADKPKTIRHLALRLDGETIETTSPERPYFVGVSIDCSTLTVGEHVVTATLRRRNGEIRKLTKILTRLPGPEPDSVFKTLARRHMDGICDRGTPDERRCSMAVPMPRDPSRLSVPRACARRSVRLTANARNPATLRSLVLRLDGRNLAATEPGERHSYWVVATVQCANLTVGDHVVTATIRRRDGSVRKLTRILARPADPAPTTAR